MIKNLAVVFGIGIVFLDMTIAHIPFPLQISNIMLVLLVGIVLMSCGVSLLKFAWLSLLVLYSLLLYAFQGPSSEFWGTFFYFWMFILVLSLRYESCKLPMRQLVFYLSRFAILFISIHSLFLIAQSIVFNLTGDLYLLNPLGEFSGKGPGLPGGNGRYWIWPSMSPKKANGLLGEPSYAAIICNFAVTILYCLSSNYKRSVWLTLLFANIGGLLSTFSASGFVTFAILSLVFGFINSFSLKKYFNSYKNKFIKILFIFIVCFGATAAIIDRSSEFKDNASSGYIRVTGPVLLLADAIVEYPLGVFLGNTEYAASKNYIFHHDPDQIGNLDNTAFIFLLNFGVIGYIILMYLILIFMRNLLLRRKEVLIFSFIFLSICATGSGYTPRFAYILCVCMLLGGYLRDRSKSNYPY